MLRPVQVHKTLVCGCLAQVAKDRVYCVVRPKISVRTTRAFYGIDLA